MKKYAQEYTFDASARTITCADFTDLSFIDLITNVTTNTIIYQFNNPAKGGSLTGTVLTLDFDTTAMSDTDDLKIILNPDSFTESGAISVGNARQKFRDGFTLGVLPEIWDETWTNQGNGFRYLGGNSLGASYMGVCLPTNQADAEYILLSKKTFSMPIRFGYGFSMSQRVLGQEAEISLVGVNADGTVQTTTPIAPLTISGNISVTSNVGTVNFATAHGLTGSDRVVLVGNVDTRMNVGPVLVTVVTATQITVPISIANGTYTAGGQVVWADIFNNVTNAAGSVFENATATNVSFGVRRNGTRPVSVNTTTATTVATQISTNPFTQSFRSSVDNELISTLESVKFVSRGASSQSGVSGSNKYTESIPDEERLYKIRFRFRNLPNYARVLAQITSIAKTGTTTATVTTDVPHGLTTGNLVTIYGVRDLTNFPNLTSQTSVASVPTSTTFTIVIGTASTTSSSGGVVGISQGNINLSAFNFSVQSIVAANNILTATLNTTASGFINGEIIELAGMQGAAAPYNGAYIVGRTNAATLEFIPLPGNTIANITSTNTGGAILRKTDCRIHYARVLDYTRHLVEISNNRGVNDQSEAVPFVGAISGTVGLNSGTATGPIPTPVTDIASAAITTTTTTAAFTPSWGNTYQVVIPVTAVTGTSPTMIVRIEESSDSGTTWRTRYTFPTITATGLYESPILRVRGNRVRYVQTIGGTTPSFTRAINRNQRMDSFFSGVPGQLISAASTNATAVFAAPCELTKLTVSNTNAAARYLKLYDLAVAPTVGTSVPVATYIIPGATAGAGSNVPLTIPDGFMTGFALAITTGPTVADTGAVGANEIIVNYSIA